MPDRGEYFDYLAGRSKLGLAYRRYWLYPRLSRYLSGRVLDVGCGIGDMLAYRPGAVGVDINERTVAWCRSKGYDAHVMVPDVLPFAAASFDCVVFDNVLEHLTDPEPLLREIHRVLVPAGRVVVGVPGTRGYARDPDHKVFYQEASLSACLAHAGFRAHRLFHMPLDWGLLDRYMSQYCLYGVFDRCSSVDGEAGSD